MSAKQRLARKIAIAAHREPADLVITNGRIVDVFNLEVISGDVAICDGSIVGIGRYEGVRTIDAQQRYICPGFIDGHVHIESSMVAPAEFAKVILPHGVTTVIADPHEIANVAGVQGIEYMLEASEKAGVDVFVMLPSSVPATPYENAGAELKASDLEPLWLHERVLGLGEVMDYPAVLHAEDDMLDKIIAAGRYAGKQIDGHAAGLGEDAINVYMTAGIRTDHEAVSASEAIDRLRRGMHLIIREGTAAKDLRALIEIVNGKNARRCFFCTDDKHLDDLFEQGSIDHNVRLAIRHGVDPMTAIQMATLNCAECYGLKSKGAVAPGYDADLLLLDDLENVTVCQVYKSGHLAAENGEYVLPGCQVVTPPESIMNSVRMKEVKNIDLAIRLETSRMARVIGIIPNRLITRHLIEEVDVEHGCFRPSIDKDQLKLAVVERHRETGNIGLGIVKGLGIRSGAIASTVAHDSHNIIAAGTNDEDLLAAIRAVERMKGGLSVARNEEVVAAIALPVAGLIADRPSSVVYRELKQLNEALASLGCRRDFNPFLTLSFLSLPVIPQLKLTDMGIFDVEAFRHIAIAVT
jgi:adenine deaminase